VKEVLFQKDAKAELAEAVDFYEQRRAGLGLEFQDEVEAAVKLIRQHPHRFGIYQQSQFRKCVMQRFPYLVFYWEREDAIWIMAVAHAKRKPGYWLGRQVD
jgi:toxin ParE1/3/4